MSESTGEIKPRAVVLGGKLIAFVIKVIANYNEEVIQP